MPQRRVIATVKRKLQAIGQAHLHQFQVCAHELHFVRQRAERFVQARHRGAQALLARSFDDWALSGLAVAKEPSVVGARRTAQDLVVPVVSYPHRPPNAGRVSVYPRVFLASGRQAPVLLPAADASSKVIHLPYTELLAPDGSPKAAKDLWSVLAKAGVPRHAEILTVADDAGEAAVSWFVLKLMGFADVKLRLPG